MPQRARRIKVKNMGKKKRKTETVDIGCPEVRRFRLNELKPAEYNPRTISDEALEGLARSIEKFGCVEPIVVNTRGGKQTVIGGHQRLKVLKAAKAKEVLCVAVDLSKADEKLLNLTLNNPKVQGEFIEAIGEYIEQLKEEIPEQDFLGLKIKKLHEDIGDKYEKMTYSEENLMPFKKTHVLLSFEPAILAEIQDHLEAIIRTEGVEYEQGSN